MMPTERTRRTRRFAVFLRAISNVPMLGFRRQLESLGFADVESYGMSGNLLFTSGSDDAEDMERRIGTQLGTDAFVRSIRALEQIISRDPFNSSVMILDRAPSKDRRRALAEAAFESPRPVLYGRTLYFVYPARIAGKRTPVNFETLLNLRGTARSAGVMRGMLSRLLVSRTKRPRRGSKN
jgi:uncharacterized protein (DUF1697 family)